MSSDKPSVYVKRSKINEIFEYCMDNGIPFNVQERSMGIDEFEVHLEIDNIKKAVQLGYFLKENRLELAGSQNPETKTTARKPAVRKPAEPFANTPLIPKTEPATEKPVSSAITQTEVPAENNPENVSLSFDLN